MAVSSELLAACRGGDREAFEELVRRTHGQVYTLACRLVGDRAEAEDVVQEAYLRAFRAIGGFREEARFETWLYRIVANTAMTHLRRRGRFGELLADEDDRDFERPEQRSPADEVVERDEVRRVLEGLPLGLRTVMVLKDVYGLSCREIGQEMGLTEGAVKVRLHRARRRVKEEIYGSTRHEV